MGNCYKTKDLRNKPLYEYITKKILIRKRYFKKFLTHILKIKIYKTNNKEKEINI